MPEAVVDQLELVEVDEENSEQLVLLSRSLDCGLQAVNEVEAVWEVSERVDTLAFSDIGLRAGHPDCLSVLITHCDAATERPDIAAVFVPHAVFTNKFLSLAVAMRGNLRTNPLTVFGMNMAEPFFVARPGLAL